MKKTLCFALLAMVLLSTSVFARGKHHHRKETKNSFNVAFSFNSGRSLFSQPYYPVYARPVVIVQPRPVYVVNPYACQPAPVVYVDRPYYSNPYWY